MSLQELVDISHFYGANTDFVIAGGGNTSFKDGKTLYIKGSGTSLADITAEGFVRMDRDALGKIWKNAYPQNAAERESAVLADMMAARMKGENKRPSVETLLHDIIPFCYVVHTHPTLVNALTCSVQGENAMRELFGDDAAWIPSLNPGYVLSKAVRELLAERNAKGLNTAIIFLQNHGIFVGADSFEGIKNHFEHIINKIKNRIKREPCMTELPMPDKANKIGEALKSTAKELTGDNWFSNFHLDKESASLIKSRAAFAPVSQAFTPDHIVYAGGETLFIEKEIQLLDNLKALYAINKSIPKTAAVKDVGVFGLGKTEKAAITAIKLFSDSVKISVYAQSFGGEKFMSREQIDFINNWEVERYRSAVSVGK